MKHSFESSDWETVSQTVVARTLAGSTSPNVIVVFISGWFDAKWHRFSGNSMGAVSTWRQRLTVPPFHPSRVLKENHFHIQSGALPSQGSAPEKKLHGERSSESNSRMYLDMLHPDSHIFWLSSPSEERFTVMHYHVCEHSAYGWYLGFERTDTWRVRRHRGLSTIEIANLLPENAASPAADLELLQSSGIADAWIGLPYSSRLQMS